MRADWRGWSAIVLVASGVVGCGGDSAPAATGSGASPNGGAGSGGSGLAGGGAPGSGGGVPVPQSFSALKAKADAAKALTRDEVLAAYPTAFESLGYDPLGAAYLDKIQASSLALNDTEKTALGEHGFVISPRREFPTFVHGYAQIYSEHLPVYISADALLETVHHGYDSTLLRVEQATLVPQVRSLLEGMRQRLSRADASPEARADVDVYLAVALTLLTGTPSSPVAGGSASKITALVRQAQEASGTANVELFGATRDEDFSQFKPRGHYADSPPLQQYFRAMIWLGRVDFRIVETTPQGKQVFQRPQYEAMLLVRDVLEADLARWQRIDDALATFVGESDNLVPPEVDRLVADLGGPAQARAASDERVMKAILEGGYGQQQIASYLMVNDAPGQTLPLNRSFLLLGQRYVVDSHVFSGVVYDRLQAKRMMPSTFDAAFGALGNNQAFALNPDVDRFGELPGALARLRVLVDSYDPAFWESSFYNLWFSALRKLSPTSVPLGLPKVARTEAWGRRLLNTQLGSWAELRHDTLLYAKQSYTGIPGCDFPDAYVDPYPEVFGALRKYAEQGARLAKIAEADSPPLAASITEYFETLRKASATLEEIAKQELEGKPLTEEQLAFVNDAVRIESENVVCATVDVPDGWLAKLYYDPKSSIEFEPTIADVHTQPADEHGNLVGKVLHVGTGYPRLMVATAEACSGPPRAYAGVVFAYHEKVTEDFLRLTDEEWESGFRTGGSRPADVPWLAPALAK